jgi:hypothetical protein
MKHLRMTSAVFGHTVSDCHPWYIYGSFSMKKAGPVVEFNFYMARRPLYLMGRRAADFAMEKRLLRMERCLFRIEKTLGYMQNIQGNSPRGQFLHLSDTMQSQTLSVPQRPYPLYIPSTTGSMMSPSLRKAERGSASSMTRIYPMRTSLAKRRFRYKTRQKIVISQ